MNKAQLKDKIRFLVKQKYSKSQEDSSKQIDLDDASLVSLDDTRFPVLSKFPTLKSTIVKLLTNQYDLFLSDIEWVAPRPTTFRVVLANDQVFYLIYTERTWIGKVEGKKYYLLNISEEQNCVESIARILSYGAKITPQQPTTPEPIYKEPTPPSTDDTSIAPETPIEEPEEPTTEPPEETPEVTP